MPGPHCGPPWTLLKGQKRPLVRAPLSRLSLNLVVYQPFNWVLCFIRGNHCTPMAVHL